MEPHHLLIKVIAINNDTIYNVKYLWCYGFVYLPNHIHKILTQ